MVFSTLAVVVSVTATNVSTKELLKYQLVGLFLQRNVCVY